MSAISGATFAVNILPCWTTRYFPDANIKNFCIEFNYKPVSSKAFSKRLQNTKFKIEKGSQNKTVIYLTTHDVNENK